MPQSLSRILIHLVFSTKNRERILTPAIQTELHPYLAVTLGNIECPSLQAGGVEDHVHLFFDLSHTRTIADVVETVKTSSSKWNRGPANSDRLVVRTDCRRSSLFLPWKAQYFYCLFQKIGCSGPHSERMGGWVRKIPVKPSGQYSFGSSAVIQIKEDLYELSMV